MSYELKNIDFFQEGYLTFFHTTFSAFITSTLEKGLGVREYIENTAERVLKEHVDYTIHNHHDYGDITFIIQFENEQDKIHVENIMGYGQPELLQEMAQIVIDYHQDPDILDEGFHLAIPPRFIRGFFYGSNYEMIYENPNFNPQKWL
jgi:hypothetical protein